MKDSRRNPMKVKFNLSIDPRLRKIAEQHAEKVHFTDLAGYITKLIVADLHSAKSSAAIRPQRKVGQSNSVSNAAA